jgi:hypothetical protein
MLPSCAALRDNELLPGPQALVDDWSHEALNNAAGLQLLRQRSLFTRQPLPWVRHNLFAHSRALG